MSLGAEGGGFSAFVLLHLSNGPHLKLQNHLGSLNLSLRVLIKHGGREGWQASHSSLPHVNSSFCES